MGLWAEIRKLAEIRQPEPRKPDFGHPEEQLSGLHKDLNGAIVEQGRNHPAWKHTLAKAAGAPSEFGEFGVWVAASRSQGRRPRCQAEGVENLSGHDRILDGCQNSHPRAAARTLQDIWREHPRHQLSPRVIARAKSRNACLT